MMMNQTDTIGSSSYLQASTMKGSKKSKKPLPLKQRTSSVDPRRDFSSQTWTSLLGIVKMREFLVTVDHFSIWRRHLAWAIEDGEELREQIVKRYSSSMVFMSLLLSTELGVLFNSAEITTEVRKSLAAEELFSVTFWIGIFIILSAILTIMSLISIFTAWSMVSSVNAKNAHCIFRSSIGQYSSELPGRFIVSSIYVFLVWILLFFFVLLPVGYLSAILLFFTLALFVHTITAFSSFGRVIMHTGAMGSQRIFAEDYEKTLAPHAIHHSLLMKAKDNLQKNTSIRRQYLHKMAPINSPVSEDFLSMQFSDSSFVSILSSSSPTSKGFSPSINDFNNNKDFAKPGPGLPIPPSVATEKEPSQSSRVSSTQSSPTPASPESSIKNCATSSTSDTSPSSSPRKGAVRNGLRPRSNSFVRFSDGFTPEGKRVDVTSPTHGTRRSLPLSSAGKSKASGEEKKEEPKQRPSLPRSSSDGRVEGAQVSRPMHVHTRVSSSGGGSVSSPGPQTMAPMWRPQHQQRHAVHAPPHAFQNNGQFYYPPPPPPLALSPVASGKWASSSGAMESRPHDPQMHQFSQQRPFSSPPGGYYNHQIYHHQQNFVPQHQYSYEEDSSSVPEMVSRVHRASDVSDLEGNFALYQEKFNQSKDNMECYDDEDIQGLLDPEPMSGSNGSVQTKSSQGTNEKPSKLLGLDYDEEGGTVDPPETDALLNSSNHDYNYKSIA